MRPLRGRRAGRTDRDRLPHRCRKRPTALPRRLPHLQFLLIFFTAAGIHTPYQEKRPRAPPGTHAASRSRPAYRPPRSAGVVPRSRTAAETEAAGTAARTILAGSNAPPTNWSRSCRAMPMFCRRTHRVRSSPCIRPSGLTSPSVRRPAVHRARCARRACRPTFRQTISHASMR